MITETLLNSYLGLHIADICPGRYTSDDDSHCAHFVSHVLGLDFRRTCGAGANIRVQEIFERCTGVYEFNSCPTVVSGLIFVSDTRNFIVNPRIAPNGHTIQNVSDKHIGIILNGKIWHYSNTQRQVKVYSMLQFISHYSHPVDRLGRTLPTPRARRGVTYALWYGQIPAGAAARAHGSGAVPATP